MEERADDATWELANEYALVRVRSVPTHNGVRLEISAPQLDRTIRLCPLELESLTWQTHETFSKFLQTPFGPEPEADRRPPQLAPPRGEEVRHDD